jgi:hypothetical protein
MEMETLSDFPKLFCPFIRQTFKVNKDHFREFGRGCQLRTPEVYLAIDRVNPGYEWVFEDPETIAVEKLNGTNIKLKTENGRLIALQNRKNIIDPLQIIKGKTFIVEGIFRSVAKGYVKAEGEQAGELIGPSVNGNPYKMDFHEWYPFEKAIADLNYKSFSGHERTFANWSGWFKDWLFSRLYTKLASKKGIDDKVFAEGVVFYNFRRQAEGKVYRAKLRRDMFDWFYDKIEIFNYDAKGRAEIEDQEQFD